MTDNTVFIGCRENFEKGSSRNPFLLLVPLHFIIDESTEFQKAWNCRSIVIQLQLLLCCGLWYLSLFAYVMLLNLAVMMGFWLNKGRMDRETVVLV